jgi:phosphatase NudJ
MGGYTLTDWPTANGARSANHKGKGSMFKPHVTVACVVHAKDKFLIVEETINGKALWNQPAGHLEADETLVQAAERAGEETGIRATPQHFIRMHQWIAPDNTPFLRFLFAIELNDTCATKPHDSDIDRCLWLSARILNAPNLRSRWLPKASAAINRTRAIRCR